MRSQIHAPLAGLVVSTIALVAAAPSLAGELAANSRIEAVMVYPDAATVSRVVEIDLPAGATSLVFSNLPNTIDPVSLRVEGTANGKLAIGSVEARTTPAEAPQADTAIETKLRQLRTDRETVQASIEALDAKKAMISRFGQSGPEKLAPESAPLDIEKWSTAWEAVGRGLAKVGDDLRIARASARELDEQIRALEQSRVRPQPANGPRRTVTVELETDAALKGRIVLSYRVAAAGWRPQYDAKLDTGAQGRKASLELVRRASITQRTGEDWTGVALSVSTVQSRRGVQPPDMQTQRLAFWEPPPPVVRGQVLRKDAPASAMMEDARQRENLAAAAPAPARPEQAATEQQADLDASAFQASFRIPGRIDVPSDGSTRNVRIGARTIVPELSARAVPALDPTAYLSAHFIHEEEAPLLAGEISIHRDGTFVGNGRMAFVATGDSADLSFGADDRIKVVRVPVKRKENEPTWFGQTKTEIREFKTTVRNLHDFAMRVNVVDQIPISENTAIVIEQLPATTPPTEKIVADKRGVMGWTYAVNPNETKEIKIAYRMKWPADREVVFQRTN